jgi:hypothetical protein
MYVIYPQAFFSTAGMTSLLTIVIVVEMLSLAFFGMVVYAFRRMLHRHARFFRSIGGDDAHLTIERPSFVIFWIYVIVTLLATLLTTYLFVFQPHLL